MLTNLIVAPTVLGTMAADTRLPTLFIVRRFGPGRARKSYGPFAERVTAERVAVAAIEKYVDATVMVEPVNDCAPKRAPRAA